MRKVTRIAMNIHIIGSRECPPAPIEIVSPDRADRKAEPASAGRTSPPGRPAARHQHGQTLTESKRTDLAYMPTDNAHKAALGTDASWLGNRPEANAWDRDGGPGTRAGPVPGRPAVRVPAS